ncbi:molybdopterin converting factor subunit 1 [Methylocella sp.]|uniref:molybdopterin converting factor subunit 1 n=1 Tax=Methylocella sp. TaxID=1978226 RepID=UPI003784130F
MKALYFASVREKVGLAEEEFTPPDGVATLGELIGWLRGRGEGYADAFGHDRAVRAAIDRAHARPEAPISGAREIAFFPPMTGG